MSGHGGARHVLFLQGMPSPFFRRVARHLEAAGCRATGIVLCFGDWAFWHGRGTIHYRGMRRNWPAFVRRVLEREAVTDIVLLGEQRSYHRQAIAVARELGVRVAVTDFGYLRPDWLTLEPDGMNGASRFPRDPEAIRRLAAGAPAPDPRPQFQDSFRNMAAGDVLYSFGNVFVPYLYPFYRRSDARPNPFVYFAAMARRLLTQDARRRREGARWERFRSVGAPYFLVPLQLAHDFQIVSYSPFPRYEEAIETIVESFAAHADEDAHLVLKVHPWDPALQDHGAVAARAAGRHGAASRVHTFDGGDLDAMIREARGTVTVNSTSGIRAIELGNPVKVLGQAIYDVPGLTFGGPLEAFWRGAPAPDAALFGDWIRALAASSLVRGVFFQDPGREEGARAVARRLLEGTVGRVVLPPAPPLRAE